MKYNAKKGGKMINFKIVRINTDYCEYLRQFEDKVPYNKNDKELRPFIGILFEIDVCEYFAPLSSPKPKHKKMKNSLDFVKIKDGDLGAINFNNMIPVTVENYSLVDLDKKDNGDKEKYRKLLLEQLNWLNHNREKIINKANKLYDLYICGKLPLNIIERCCDFKLLEEKCREYIKV